MPTVRAASSFLSFLPFLLVPSDLSSFAFHSSLLNFVLEGGSSIASHLFFILKLAPPAPTVLKQPPSFVSLKNALLTSPITSSPLPPFYAISSFVFMCAPHFTIDPNTSFFCAYPHFPFTLLAILSPSVYISMKSSSTPMRSQPPVVSFAFKRTKT